MIALDTNVLIRYLMADDPQQAQKARALIESATDQGEAFFVSHIVLCETVQVLARAFKLPKSVLADVLNDVLRKAQFVIEAPDLVVRALARFKGGQADFSDYLISEQAAASGCTRVATFDKRPLQEDGFFSL